MDIKFDRYHTYEDMTSILKHLAEKHPNLMRLSSICTSPESREIWLVEITNLETGDFLDKPALSLDANHHAGEVTGCACALNTIYHLVEDFGKDESITEVLNNTTFYVIPRVAVDGAEYYMTTGEKVRSAPRMYPFADKMPGLHQRDMDGDGVSRMMRVKSPYGNWKKSSKDQRIMVKRRPDDLKGEFYHVYHEGEVIDYDGIHVKAPINKWNNDFNRNYPIEWRHETTQKGAGTYPLSNPETKAMADFVLSHPNICSAVSNHTTEGVMMCPPGNKHPDLCNKRDMELFKSLALIGTEETGYPYVNIYIDTDSKPETTHSGGFDDWLYWSHGIPGITVELWDAHNKADMGAFWLAAEGLNKSHDEREDDFHKLVEWVDKIYGKDHIDGYKDWTKFDHPQLGEVEIGGMNFKFTVQNPPPCYLEEICEGMTRFIVRNAKTLPHLVIDEIKKEKVDENTYKISAIVSNAGYMSTFIMEEAKVAKADKHVNVTIELPKGAEIISGQIKTDIGHLEGFSGVNSSYVYDAVHYMGNEPQTKKVEWIIKANTGDEIKITAKSDKVGIVTEKTVL